MMMTAAVAVAVKEEEKNCRERERHCRYIHTNDVHNSIIHSDHRIVSRLEASLSQFLVERGAQIYTRDFIHLLSSIIYLGSAVYRPYDNQLRFR